MLGLPLTREDFGAPVIAYDNVAMISGGNWRLTFRDMFFLLQ